MKTLKNYILIAGLIFVIPIIGIFVGFLVSQGYEKQYENVIIQAINEKKGIDVSENQQFLNGIKLERICNTSNLDPIFSSVCSEYEVMSFLTYGSILTLIFTILIISFIYVLGLLSRNNRNLLFYLFRPGLFISQIAAALLVTANAGIIIISIYLAESFYLGRVHFVLIGGLGIVAAVTAISVLIKSFSPVKSAETRVFGKNLSKDQYPIIWNFTELLAKKVGSNPPDTIIAGMDPTFFVTEAKVIYLDGESKGRTLFLSLPFCRALSKNELSAIIGHEMGHFIGEDTKWSKKFYPIYRGSVETMAFLINSGSNGLAQLAYLPAILFMSIFISAFEKSEKAINRERELNADSIGVKITSKEEMASSIIKSHVYQYIWNFTLEKMKEALISGKQIKNVSIFFASVCASIPRDFMKNEIGKSHTPHPTDTHPLLSVRLESMNINLDEIYSVKT